MKLEMKGEVVKTVMESSTPLSVNNIVEIMRGNGVPEERLNSVSGLCSHLWRAKLLDRQTTTGGYLYSPNSLTKNFKTIPLSTHRKRKPEQTKKDDEVFIRYQEMEFTVEEAMNLYLKLQILFK